MINYIKGSLEIKDDNFIVVETGGIGYTIFVPTNSKFYLNEIGDTVKVYTYMSVKEDDISLFGFENYGAIDVFRKLISVNGVGAKAGISICSALSVEDIKKAIVFEDATILTKANGIGKKIAQRIVLDLKDKFENLEFTSDSSATVKDVKNSNAKQEALNALIELGYTKVEAMEALAKITDEDLSVETYIKKALRNF